MMKVVLALMLCSLMQRPVENRSTVVWSSMSQLRYADFQAPIDPSSPYLALSNCGINYTVEVADDTAYIRLYAVFKPAMSWIRQRTPQVLHHEQGHFDICERTARVLRSQVLRYESSITKDNAHDLVETLVNNILASHDHNQSIYESSVGDARIQSYWDRITKHDIDSLSAYSDPLLKIGLN